MYDVVVKSSCSLSHLLRSFLLNSVCIDDRKCSHQVCCRSVVYTTTSWRRLLHDCKLGLIIKKWYRPMSSYSTILSFIHIRLLILDRTQVNLHTNSNALSTYFNKENGAPMRSVLFLTMGTAFPLKMTTKFRSENLWHCPPIVRRWSTVQRVLGAIGHRRSPWRPRLSTLPPSDWTRTRGSPVGQRDCRTPPPALSTQNSLSTSLFQTQSHSLQYNTIFVYYKLQLNTTDAI